MDLTSFEIIRNREDTFFIKEDLCYRDFLKLQKDLLSKCREDRKKRYHIICNHPPLFTHGRGLQRRTGQDLQNFNPSTHKSTLEFHQIKRGGGLTFHHPGQVILYSIINLNRADWDLKRHYCFLMNSFAHCIKLNYKLSLECSTKLAGVWKGKRKLASIGVGVEHFVTTHGIALNLNFTKEDLNNLELTYPCGLESKVYTSLSELTHQDISFKNFIDLNLDEITLRNNYLQ